MRILFVADGRSQIALNWIAYFIGQGHEVHLASTYPCQPDLNFECIAEIPVAFSGMAGEGTRGSSGGSLIRKLTTPAMRTRIRQMLGPSTLKPAAEKLSEIARKLQPDLVHAMRIPYEGMIAAQADLGAPLLVSVWGNDFTLHANSSRIMGRLTTYVLKHVDAIHADVQRDIRLARLWGLPENIPTTVLPGGGGIQADQFFPLDEESWLKSRQVINPRGFRAYIRNDAFFKSIPLVLEKNPDVHFVGPNMAHEPDAVKWVADLGIAENISLLPRQSRAEMAKLFQNSSIVVSPSIHDGTPNTLLEAMACGCFPIAGDIDSIREWIVPGENGLLIDPSDPEALAYAIGFALDEPELRKRALYFNLTMVEDKAAYETVMPEAEKFYQSLIRK